MKLASKTIKLVEPLELGSETLDSLEVRRPKAKDLRKFPTDAKDLGGMLDFAGSLCGQPPSVMDRLEIEDAMKVFEAITDFLPDSLKIGSNA